MASAFSANIDTSGLFGEADGKVAKLSKKLEELQYSIKGPSDAFLKLGEAISKLPIRPVTKGMSALGFAGVKALNGLTLAAKAFGIALKAALGPLRLIFFVFELIKKANPFKLISDALNKLYGNAKGSTALGNSAKDLKTSEAKLRALERAEEVHKLGINKDFVAQIRSNLTKAELQGSFQTATNFSSDKLEELRKKDGIDASLEILGAFFKKVGSRGRDDVFADAELRQHAEAIGLNYDNYYSQKAGFGEFMKDYWHNVKTDEGGDKERQDFEKSFTRLSQAFDKLINTILKPFMKPMRSFIDWLTEWVNQLTSAFQLFEAGEYKKGLAVMFGADPNETPEQKKEREARGRKAQSMLGYHASFGLGRFSQAAGDLTIQQKQALARELGKRYDAIEDKGRYSSGKYEIEEKFVKVAQNKYEIKVMAKNVKTGKSDLLIADTFEIQ